MQRDDHRLLEADQKLGEARARVVWHRAVYVRYHTFITLARSMLKRPRDRALRAFYRRAYERALEIPPVPAWESMWPGIRAGNIWDYNARQYGLCLSRSLCDLRAY